jgi:integrase
MKSTPNKATRKPTRSKADTFPLFLRSDGRWSKKIDGKPVYFGRDKAEALERYKRHIGLVAVGMDPETDGVLTIGQLFDQYLTFQRSECEAGNIGPRSVSDSAATLRRFTEAVGGRTRAVISLSTADFAKVKTKLSKDRSPLTAGNDIRRIKAAFNWAADSNDGEPPLISKLPPFGKTFKGPPRRVVERAKSKRHNLLFEPDELRELIAEANVQLKAMIYLGLNAALLPVDLARLELSDFSKGFEWLALERFKTGEPRRAWLWEETRDAIKAAKDVRPKPAAPEHAGLLFLTEAGNPVVRTRTPKKAAKDVKAELSATIINRPTADFRELCITQDCYRKGRGFGQLRHVFLTIAEGGLDFVAVSKVMGHRVPGATSHYRHYVSDDRIKAACNVVRDWLLSTEAKPR